MYVLFDTDIVKTKQQVDPIKYQGNALSALNNIISSEGFSNILSSVLVAFAVYFMEGVVKVRCVLYVVRNTICLFIGICVHELHYVSLHLLH